MSKNAAPQKPQDAATLPLETAADLFRFSIGTALEVQKRALDLATRQHAIAVKAAAEAVGLYDETVRQSFTDGQGVLVAAASRARSVLDRWAEPVAA